MNTELQSKLVEIIGTIQTSVGKTTTFVMEQLPDIAQQYITFGRVTETLYFALALLGLLFFPYMFVTQAKKANAAPYNDADLPIILSAASGVLGFASLIGFFANITPFFMVWFAPKLYLIKGLAALLK